jgi:long-chain acyl-CoA synthetase
MSEITSLAEIVRVHSRERPDQVAVILDDRRQTWSELYERSQRMAAALSDAGVASQDRVAFFDKNGIEHFELALGGTRGALHRE